MQYPEMEDVEEFRLTFIRCLKLPQVVDIVRKTKVLDINSEVEQTGKN